MRGYGKLLTISDEDRAELVRWAQVGHRSTQDGPAISTELGQVANRFPTVTALAPF
jgi:hypothetical protein